MMDNEKRETVDERILSALAPLEKLDQEFQPTTRVIEKGNVLSVDGPIVRVDGVVHAEYLEKMEIRNRDGSWRTGVALDLLPEQVSIVMLDDVSGILPGNEVRRTGSVLQVPVGSDALGRIVDALGRPLDGKEEIQAEDFWPVERASPKIVEREAVNKPLQTGVLAVDTLIPIGRGQRQLVIGDRQTGKTSLAIDVILGQKADDVICIYCAIGTSLTNIARIRKRLEKHNVLENVVIVVAAGDDPVGLNFIAPYSATTMAEYFLQKGKDVLVVYDDLTHHAKSYRELSLLLRRPPGREAFPGDIFYLHSRLLERSAKLSPAKGGGSITSLPIAETEAQNISAYIPTNLVSITDGQIYLSPRLFVQNQLPAIDVMKSVSRVGGQAQLPLFRQESAALRLSYAQFEELESFTRFDAMIDESTRKVLNRGKRVREVLKQDEGSPLPVKTQILMLKVLNAGYLDSLPVEQIHGVQEKLVKLFESAEPVLSKKIAEGKILSEEENRRILGVCKEAIENISKGN